MGEKRLLLIINPISGAYDKRGLYTFVSQRMAKVGYSVETVYTKGCGDASLYAQRAIADGFDAVAVAGGDGTINEVAKVLCGSKVALAILPAGSGNGLARHLRLPIDAAMAVDVMAQENIVECDYCSVNGTPFFCTFGIGFDAVVSDSFAHQSRRGRFMYVKSVVDHFRNYTPEEYEIEIDGGNVIKCKAFIIACCNASQYGNNAYIAPSADITDGLLDITIVHAGSPLNTAMLGVDLFTGYINRSTMIQTFKVPKAVLRRKDEGLAHIDGEPMMMPAELAVECHPQLLRIFAPANIEPFKPIITPVIGFFSDLKIAFRHLFKR